MTDTITLPREVAMQALEALRIGSDAFSQAFSGYGFFRPDNPHNFSPDLDCCSQQEIANHSAACEAYDKGTYVPDHSDGWITPEIHVTKAPWGIGTYTDECKEIEDAITNLRAAIEAAKQQPTNGYQAYQEHKRKRLEEAGFLKEPLREAAKCVEPVAWMGEYNINDIRDHYTVVMRHKTDFEGTPDRVRPLYTAPPAVAKDAASD